eukprot:TRINITY_DN9592_c0_g1_i1.p1 TRINITY_DN9592_c0_g1~~TRINITY_DN9592_c0_g1_i1.p1  ORF type:complete len:551 (+),score=187.56 TRINITY_DN9592_c0_g1_i1:88-1740(+)
MDPRTPVLVGVGRYTQHIDKNTDLMRASTPLQLMHKSSVMAFADAGISEGQIDVDAVATVPHLHQMLFPPATPPLYTNSPKSLGRLLKAKTAEKNEAYYAVPAGGNGPQFGINEMCNKIASGEINSVLISGSEAMATLVRARSMGWGIEGVDVPMFSMTGERKDLEQSGKKLPWGDHPGGQPIMLAPEKMMFTIQDVVHGMAPAAHVYPVFEQAFKREYARDMPRQEYQMQLSKLMSEMSAVAAEQPEHAWYPKYMTPEYIGTPSDKNRMVAFPYTKHMNSVIDVNQTASALFMSLAEARRRGIPEDRYIFIHARCHVTEEPVNTMQRGDLHRSNGMRVVRERLESLLGMPLNSVPHKEIYSCFPIAVRMACQEMGLQYKNGRELTKIGNMQFHGGPGNNLGMHGVVEMANVLRKNRGELGLVTMNGGYFSKHSAAVYSTEYKAWSPDTSKEDQELCQSYARPVTLEKRPDGTGVCHVWTVIYNKKGPSKAVAIGTLDGTGTRFLANSLDPKVMEYLLTRDTYDIPVEVKSQPGKGPALFKPLDMQEARL